MSKAKVLKLWRQGPVVARRIKGGGFSAGHVWLYERDVSPETAQAWLTQFRKDSPSDFFIVSASEPIS